MYGILLLMLYYQQRTVGSSPQDQRKYEIKKTVLKYLRLENSLIIDSVAFFKGFAPFL
jgi:hypothetical protein